MSKPQGSKNITNKPNIGKKQRGRPLKGQTCSSILNGIKTKKICHIKRPMNSFMVWAQQARNIYTKKYPELQNSEISKILGAEWKVMTTEEQYIWKSKADSINEAFKQEHPNYIYTPNREYSKKDTKDSNSFPIQLAYKEGLVILFNGADSPDVVDSTIIENLYIFLCDGSSSSNIIIPDTPYYEDPDMENMFYQSDNIFIQLGDFCINPDVIIDCSFNFNN